MLAFLDTSRSLGAPVHELSRHWGRATGLDRALAPYLTGGVIGRLDRGGPGSVAMEPIDELPLIPKTEYSREASLSSIESSPEPDIDDPTTAPENVQVQKRKGGRKPVRPPQLLCASTTCAHTDRRFTLRPRRGSSATDKLKRRFGNVGPSTSSSWRTPSNIKTRRCRTCSKATAPQPTSA